jgi:hypothetical protein
MNKLKEFLTNFKNDKQGIVKEIVITIVFTIVIAILYIIGELEVNRVADALTAYVGNNTDALNVVHNAVNYFGIGGIVIIACLFIWCGVSAQKRGSQEQPLPDGVFF